MQKVLRPFLSFFDLFYPRLCVCCKKVLSLPTQQHLCLSCQKELPFTTMHLEQENLFTQRFWGRVTIQEASACFYFIKGGKTQRIIHELKYNRQYQIGVEWGLIYGKKLKSNSNYKQVDLIIPVPLHWKKEKIRGYNQAASIAQGLSTALEKPMLPKALRRNQFANSQTQKNKIARLNNVDNAFSVDKPKALKGKHILIVDDVMTSGATMEACAIPILEIEGTRVSMVSLAIALS